MVSLKSNKLNKIIISHFVFTAVNRFEMVLRGEDDPVTQTDKFKLDLIYCRVGQNVSLRTTASGEREREN